jgi:hypothetical protein
MLSDFFKTPLDEDSSPLIYSINSRLTQNMELHILEQI